MCANSPRLLIRSFVTCDEATQLVNGWEIQMGGKGVGGHFVNKELQRGEEYFYQINVSRSAPQIHRVMSPLSAYRQVMLYLIRAHPQRGD